MATKLSKEKNLALKGFSPQERMAKCMVIERKAKCLNAFNNLILNISK